MYSTSVIHLRAAHNLWYRLWTNNIEFNIKPSMDLPDFNKSRYHNVLTESLPQLIINITNVFLTKRFQPAAIISATSSSIIIFNSMWTFIYYRFVAKKAFEEFPVNILFLGKLVTENDSVVIVSADYEINSKDIQSNENQTENDGSMELASVSVNPMRQKSVSNVKENNDTTVILNRISALEATVQQLNSALEAIVQQLKSHVGFVEEKEK